MGEIEAANPGLKGVLPKDYNRPALDKVMLGELIDLISGIAMNEPGDKAKDMLGRVYEYFLGGFAGSEGKRGGEFYTPRSVVRVLVEMLEPYKGRVYDPCCGSGGMFVQSEKFVESHGGRIGDIAIYGQESNYTTWRLAKDIRAARARGEETGLSDDEIAFYDALAENESAREVMGEPALRVIAHELVTVIKSNVTVDWMHRDGARANIRRHVKRLLRKYGYPPDFQDAAVQNVLQQAEALSAEWAA